MPTRQQQYAQRAYSQVAIKQSFPKNKQAEYASFSKSFPAVIQACGLCQAVTFACAKGHMDFIHDLETVLQTQNLEQQVRTAGLPDYQKLGRETLLAATWLKRYVEALLS